MNSLNICFPIVVKNPVYGSSENEIQLDEQMGRKTKPSIAREDQPTYQGLIFGDGNINLLPVYKLFTLTFNFFFEFIQQKL